MRNLSNRALFALSNLFFSFSVYLSKLNKKTNDDKKLKEDLEKCPDKYESIVLAADKFSENPNFSDNHQKEIAYYYFLVKYFTAVLEATSKTIPLQVFNEHRMALDHFIRAKANNDNDNIKSGKGHLYRALLDVLKLINAGLRNEIDKKQNSIPQKALGLISNGDYIKEYTSKKNEAEELLFDARCEDYKIGNDYTENKEVANRYIKAYIAHREWHKYQTDNMGNVLAIKTRYYMLKGLPVITTSIISLIIGILLEHYKQILDFFK